jgi:hypothetical protein
LIPFFISEHGFGLRNNPLIVVNLKIFEIELIDPPEKERKLVALPFRN